MEKDTKLKALRFSCQAMVTSSMMAAISLAGQFLGGNWNEASKLFVCGAIAVLFLSFFRNKREFTEALLESENGMIREAARRVASTQVASENARDERAAIAETKWQHKQELAETHWQHEQEKNRMNHERNG